MRWQDLTCINILFLFTLNPSIFFGCKEAMIDVILKEIFIPFYTNLFFNKVTFIYDDEEFCFWDLASVSC